MGLSIEVMRTGTVSPIETIRQYSPAIVIEHLVMIIKLRLPESMWSSSDALALQRKRPEFKYWSAHRCALMMSSNTNEYRVQCLLSKVDLLENRAEVLLY